MRMNTGNANNVIIVIINISINIEKFSWCILEKTNAEHKLALR